MTQRFFTSFIDFIDELIDMIRILFSPRLAMLLHIRFKITPTPMVFIRGDKIRFLNTAFAKVVNESIDTLRGRSWTSYLPDEDLRLARDTIARDEMAVFTTRWYPPDGSTISIKWAIIRSNGWLLARVVKYEGIED